MKGAPRYISDQIFLDEQFCSKSVKLYFFINSACEVSFVVGLCMLESVKLITFILFEAYSVANISVTTADLHFSSWLLPQPQPPQ